MDAWLYGCMSTTEHLCESADDATSPKAAVPGPGKRKALKAFLHKLRHSAVSGTATTEAHPASATGVLLGMFPYLRPKLTMQKLH